ncbi:unnamed protein product [Closterium sp. NIES-54]
MARPGTHVQTLLPPSSHTHAHRRSSALIGAHLPSSTLICLHRRSSALIGAHLPSSALICPHLPSSSLHTPPFPLRPAHPPTPPPAHPPTPAGAGMRCTLATGHDGEREDQPGQPALLRLLHHCPEFWEHANFCLSRILHHFSSLAPSSPPPILPFSPPPLLPSSIFSFFPSSPSSPPSLLPSSHPPLFPSSPFSLTSSLCPPLPSSSNSPPPPLFLATFSPFLFISPPPFPPFPLLPFHPLPRSPPPRPPHQNDTCESIATLFSLTASCPDPSQPCATDLLRLNPGLDCSITTATTTTSTTTSTSSTLPTGLSICLERATPLMPMCEEAVVVESAGNATCAAVLAGMKPALSALELYRMNPGIFCHRLLPPSKDTGFPGSEVQGVGWKVWWGGLGWGVRYGRL